MILDVRDLFVSFTIRGQELHAVRGISFSVAPGETVGIVGESGCGKSSAVQAITRLSHSALVRGQARFEGCDLLSMSESQLRAVRGQKIGMIFQDPFASLNPTMKIGEQIAEGLIYHGIASKKRAKSIAIDWLKRVGISDPEIRYNQYPHALSGGMRQRVLIAIALACGPKLLIADEPTTALDVTVSAQILSLLRSLQRETNSSLLLITHDLGVISSLADRVLVMYAGKIVEEGPVEQVLLHPRHPYTQLLLAASAKLDQPRSEKLIPIEGSPPTLFTLEKSCPFAPRCPFKFSFCEEEPPLKNSSACWREHD